MPWQLPSYCYSERSQNAGFHPRSHHFAIGQTRPSPKMLGFINKVLACFNCAIFNSHITWRKNFFVCTTTSKARVFLGNYVIDTVQDFLPVSSYNRTLEFSCFTLISLKCDKCCLCYSMCNCDFTICTCGNQTVINDSLLICATFQVCSVEVAAFVWILCWLV